ncbi:MAG: hypothetical protein M0009_07755, partial [Deltaproteobacteria bacterium]|nr:hypothetical protein [Deltaproteobacteria bacterium]
WGGAATYYRVSDTGSTLPFIGQEFPWQGLNYRTYSISATGDVQIPLPAKVNVTVVKYLDGVRADATSANGVSFPMKSLWSATNTNAGSTDFVLGPTGVNSPNSYEARTTYLASGAFYSVWEDTQGTVGATCGNGKLYKLAGYTTGDTLVQAVTGTPTTKTPSLSKIVSNKYVVVWNETCPPPDDDDDCDDHDNGHHYGNDKGDHHHQPKDHCKSNNGHHYGNDQGDNHPSNDDYDHDDNGRHDGNDKGDNHQSQDNGKDAKGNGSQSNNNGKDNGRK